MGTATVVKNTGGHYELSSLPQWAPFPAVLKGKLRLKAGNATNPIAVGDIVHFETDGEVTEDNPATITSVEPRTNYVIRRSTNLSRQSHIIAANIDMAFIVVSLYFPELKLPFFGQNTRNLRSLWHSS